MLMNLKNLILMFGTDHYKHSGNGLQMNIRDIYEYLDFDNRRSSIMLETEDNPYKYWYNKKIRNHYILKDKHQGYIPESFWLD